MDTSVEGAPSGKALACRRKFLQPRDLIDIQSFIWVLGSSEYE